jgi:hypothetical protein
MKPPSGDARQSVKFSLGRAIASLTGSAENGDGLIRQIDFMRFGIFRA